jgi:hypothetical protein
MFVALFTDLSLINFINGGIDNIDQQSTSTPMIIAIVIPVSTLPSKQSNDSSNKINQSVLIHNCRS